jgi:hypothetical protein
VTILRIRKRSEFKLKQRKIRRIIFQGAFHDPIVCETVSRLNRKDILGLLNEPIVEVSTVPNVQRGEVLVDSRGQGSFQRAT